MDNEHLGSPASRILKNTAIIAAIFGGAVLLCLLLRKADGIEGYDSPVIVLAVLLTARFTDGYLPGMAASVLGVICVNFFFTYPYMEFNISLAGYPLTFMTLLVVSLTTSTLTSRAKQRDRLLKENEIEKYRSALLRSISHDIRTPLTSIIGGASALLREPDLPSGASQSILRDIKKEAEWLLRMVENLLSITKLDGTQQVVKESWPAEEILGETAAKIRLAYPDAPLTTSVPDAPLFVPMDPILIEQVLFNLIENSLLHGGHVTSIRIRVREQDNHAVFLVEDDGCGFSEKLIASFNNQTYSCAVETTGDKKRNLGIGLSVCQAIIRAHNGEIRLDNGSPGASVCFSLPLNSISGKENP